jgi:hypothetical protein
MAKKKDQEMEADAALESDADDAEPRVYELGFHIDPELPTEEVKKVYQGLRDTAARPADAGTGTPHSSPGSRTRPRARGTRQSSRRQPRRSASYALSTCALTATR